MNEYTLAIGDYAKSSWSMRAWLMLKAAGMPFNTVQVRLEQSDTRANILRYSPSGKVPALALEDCVICDSLAIAETIAEKLPQAVFGEAALQSRGGLAPYDEILGKARLRCSEFSPPAETCAATRACRSGRK